MISARRKFNEMASFNTGPLPNFHSDEAEEALLSRKIDNILDNQPAPFPPSYRNLPSFSDPRATLSQTNRVK